MARFRMLAPEEDWGALVTGAGLARVAFDPGYVAAAALLEQGGRPRLAALIEDNLLLAAMPLVLRQIADADGAGDLISPFEFGGWFAAGPEAARDWGEGLATWCRESDVVTAFVRSNPLDAAMPAGLHQAGFEPGREIMHSVVDLTRGREALRAGYKPARRRQVRRGADRHGLRLEVSTDWAAMTAVYHANLDRLGADPYYYFPLAFFEAAAAHLTLLSARLPDGRLAAMHCYLADGEDVFALLPHGVVGMEKVRPNDFLYDAAFGWFAARGFRSLHLGGGRDSLVRYKQSLTPLSAPYVTARRTFLPALYDQLSARRRRRGPAKDSFFPLYRAPLPDLPDAA